MYTQHKKSDFKSEEHQKISERKSCANAAANGSLTNLQNLRDRGYDWDESTCINAALEGHNEILRWACRNGCPMSATTFVAIVSSLKTPDLSILDWLKIRSCPWDIRVLRMARERDREDIIEWLIKNNCPLEWFSEDSE